MNSFNFAFNGVKLTVHWLRVLLLNINDSRIGRLPQVTRHVTLESIHVNNEKVQKVAIKKISQPYRTPMEAKRCMRELRILRQSKHKNIVKLLDVFEFCEVDGPADVYIVTELMDATLANIVNMQLDQQRMSYLLYQLLCGIHYLHQCGIIHRDLKPNNIAINSDCTLRILDFGLSRSPQNNSFMMTPYVMTRYYRAPEVILGGHYNTEADMWSIGCIFGEMITHQILFSGSDYVDQWRIICETLGSPDMKFVKKFSPAVQSYLRTQPLQCGFSIEKLFNDSYFAADVEATDINAANARDLISKMLTIDPNDRISFLEAINHSYIVAWYDESEVISATFKFIDDDIDNATSNGTWSDLLREECQMLH